MGPYRSSPAVAVLLLTIFTVSSALDMSIISYDNNLGDGKSTGSWRTDDEVMSMYEGWLAEHGKAYNALGEKERRFQIFKDNLRYIDEQNSKNLSYKLGLNRFADLSNEEYRNTYLGTKTRAQKKRLSNRNTKSDRYAPRVGDSLPDSIDWREEGAVNPVKDQGSCGSCWAFSTISAVEGINKLVTGDLISLSEQELVDCDTTYNEGCNGGLMDYAFEFIIKNGGIDSEEDYPYKGYDAACDPYRKNARVVSIDTYEDVPVNSEEALKKAVANQPIAVAIEGGGRDFQLYYSGVFTGRCGTDLDHGVTVVGYGTDKGLDYWIVRNSWGESWGEKGYIRMQRNLGNTANGICGIAMEPSYPIKNGQNPMGKMPSSSPRTVEEIFKDYSARRSAVIRALTNDVDEFYSLCDPEKENLCLYGHPDESWEVTLPAEEVPPELPEPALGINFARDGMNRKDWLSLIAVHSDSWLLSVAFYFGARLNRNERKRLFSLTNDLPTIFEVVTGRKPVKDKPSGDIGSKSRNSKRSIDGQIRTNNKVHDASYMEDEDEHSETLCGSCGGNYSANEFWIGCDICERWYHGKCVKITPAKAESIPQYKCPPCSTKKSK